MGAVLREEGGDEGVGDGFEGAVGQGEDESAPIEEIVGGFLRLAFARAKGDKGGKDVERERGDDQFAITDLIRDDARDDDAEAKAGKAGAADGAELRAGEAEVSGPIREDAAANGEADAGGENGHETREEQAFGIGGDAGLVAHDLLEWGFL